MEKMGETKNGRAEETSAMNNNISSKKLENETLCYATCFIHSMVNMPVLMAVMELGILDMLNQSDGGGMSAADIAAKLPTKNKEKATNMLSCLLDYLVTHTLLSAVTLDSKNDRLYSLTPACNFLVADNDGFSMAPTCSSQIITAKFNSALHLKDAILEGELPFKKAYGMQLFEYGAKNPKFQERFDTSMSMISQVLIREILKTYRGFKAISTLVDVGGGNGTCLSMILSQYPHIKGINFDQPHVIANGLIHPGMEHIGGDLFNTIPKGDAIFLKYICHCFDEEACIKLLKNCYDALPKDHGKVIICESILPEEIESSDNIVSKAIFTMNMCMMLFSPGGKERTKQEYKALAFAAGFQAFQVVCSDNLLHVMELSKKEQSN